jgi:hypothetical protein
LTGDIDHFGSGTGPIIYAGKPSLAYQRSLAKFHLLAAGF